MDDEYNTAKELLLRDPSTAQALKDGGSRACCTYPQERRREAQQLGSHLWRGVAFLCYWVAVVVVADGALLDLSCGPGMFAQRFYEDATFR